jgi:hypothetical protein
MFDRARKIRHYGLIWCEHQYLRVLWAAHYVYVLTYSAFIATKGLAATTMLLRYEGYFSDITLQPLLEQGRWGNESEA